MTNTKWPTPKKRNLAASSDLRLFYESLKFIEEYDNVSKLQLKEHLSSRVRGIKLIKHLSTTGTNNLIKELGYFGWITQSGVKNNKLDITKNGRSVLKLYSSDKIKFLESLISKINSQYTIPAWFINRLWDLNQSGQGQIIIPTPRKEWHPRQRSLLNINFDSEIISEIRTTYEIITTKTPNSFPLAFEEWLRSVENSWKRLSSLKPRSGNEVLHYSPKRRLSMAMKESAVQLLFGNMNPTTGSNDFQQGIKPLATRSYMAWCPRLDELELIFYTDYNEAVPGRIIVPVAVFRRNDSTRFQKIDSIKNLEGISLSLHQPDWSEISTTFLDTLFDVYKMQSLRTKSLYVSLQDVRDELCRLLRISSSLFETFMSNTIELSYTGREKFIISLETDVREDQRKQRERKAVTIAGKTYSLIAITDQKRQ